MSHFADVSPGIIFALTDGMRRRAAGRGKRAGTLDDLKALTGVPSEIVLTDDWTGSI